ncbi:hypothetical protein FDJ23_gp047 [Erwinia phage vB_EamM_Desertfox]|uniref:Uncharacterized protein n=3 Tax=Agricanvirus TaxID=1984776 RepID=A0A1Z2XX89_9CAUD|nr:hypothetical protein FDH99_gp048 [Erwinia phage vB_EamM_Simmy50]YP_009621788.1 hypothetical protein FDJ23_gp047 [Erwinia phage vB_EamM_Desertfox]ASB43073.1 hypothetical protein SIMMY50_48 [Erwinia phage vB_EamM_Simmy50]AUG86155.1 hypothetical protein DESERTFOX_47 [Erwinia phage vB_EamM_Desertfox]
MEVVMPFIRFKAKEIKHTADAVTSLKRFFGLIDKNIDAVKIVQAFQTVDTRNEPLLENSLLIITRMPDGTKRHTHIWNSKFKEELAAFKPELVGEVRSFRLDYQLYMDGDEDNPLKRF